MHVNTVEELLESAPAQFEAVTGIITNIYERKTGGNDRRQWSVQNITLRGAWKTIRCAIWNHPELDAAWKDKTVYIIAGRGKRDVQMLATEEDDYKGEKRLILKVQDKATFTTKDPTTTTPPQVQSPPTTNQAPPLPQAPQNAPAMPPEQHHQAPPTTVTQPPPPQPPPQSPTNAREAWAESDKHFQIIRRSYLRSIMVANRIMKDCKEMGLAFPEDGLQGIATSMFIEFARRGGLMQVPDCDPAQPAKPVATPQSNEFGNDQEYRY